MTALGYRLHGIEKDHALERNPMSPELRKAGEELIEVGLAIEASQVEDGDPPYRIVRADYEKLLQAMARVNAALRSVATLHGPPLRAD